MSGRMLMSNEATPDLAQQARDILDRIRFVVLGTIDEDGRTRTSPVYFVPHGYQDLYWVSNPTSHHSQNLARDARVSGVVFDSTVPPGPNTGAVYVTGIGREIAEDELDEHLPRAFKESRGALAFTADELTVDGLVEFAQAREVDAASSETRAAYAAELGRAGRVTSWPPALRQKCWCGSGKSYWDCCAAS